MLVVVSTMMLPPQVVVIPMYLVWAQQLHLTGSVWPLIISHRGPSSKASHSPE